MVGKGEKELRVIPEEVIEQKIFIIRRKKVMLAMDLAKLYGVRTKRLNEQVKRNKKRFPPEFMFHLTEKEFKNLKSQIATSSWGGARKQPYAFTEYGILMLSSVLNSERGIQVNIQIIKTFTKLKEMVMSHKDLQKKIEAMEEKYDHQFKVVFDAIKEIITPSEKPKRKIGFIN